MDEPLQSYDRTLKLPCEGLESGRSHKTELDARIKEAVASLASGTGQLQCELQEDGSGNFSATLKTKSYVVSLQTRYGQNVTYVGGERRVFISYVIRAENRIAALDRAADTAENLRGVLKILGAVAGPFALFGLFSLILRLLGFVIIPYVLIAIALIGGVWCGGKLGDLLGTALERRAERRAERSGVLLEADSLWDKLTRNLDLIIQPYERV
ncbi:MAG: hypothetical protein ABSD57_06690 [Verrucomicrobiota bacterium]|jgi:hypothetical protein